MSRKIPHSSSHSHSTAGARAGEKAAAAGKKSPGASAPKATVKRGRGRPSNKKKGAAPEPEDAGAGEAAANGGPRVIRRYGNRRLYDAQLSRCVTMEEIAGFVRDGEEVQVIDADSGGDITKRILVQIILEDQNCAQLELLPVSLLRSLLAMPGKSESLSSWLEQYLVAGADWIDRAGKQAAAVMTPPAMPNPGTPVWSWPFMNMAMPNIPMGPMGPMGQAGATNPFHSAGAANVAGATPMGHTHKEAAPPAPTSSHPAAAKDSEAEMRRRLDEMEKTIAGIANKKRR